MNTPEKYEQHFREKLVEMQLPDVDFAWKEMQKKLDEQKRRRVILPWIYLLAALLILSTSLLLVFNNSSDSKSSVSNSSKFHSENTNTNFVQQPDSQKYQDHSSIETGNTVQGELTNNDKIKFGAPASDLQKSVSGKSIIGLSSVASELIQPNYADNKNNSRKRKSKALQQKTKFKIDDGVIVESAYGLANKKKSIQTENSALQIIISNPETEDMVSDSVKDSGTNTVGSISEISVTKNKDTQNLIRTQDTTALFIQAPTNHKTSKPNNSRAYIAEFAGLKQNLPLGNQKFFGYNFSGNRQIFTDYIPFIQLKYMSAKKWKGMLEFSFAAPQFDDGNVYYRKSTFLAASDEIKRVEYKIEKSYAHELLLGIEYKIYKGWWMGGSIGYSKLFKVLTQRSVTAYDEHNDQRSISSEIISSASRDSFFYSGRMTSFIQAGYEWKKWSVGLRYKADLQPYMIYTTPEGQQRKRTYSAAQLFVTYRFWKFR